METIAKRIYRADEVLADKQNSRPAEAVGRAGIRRPADLYGEKPNTASAPIQPLRGAPTGHSVPVREVRLAAGAGFIVAVCGEIMTMPGSAARTIRRGDHAER